MSDTSEEPEVAQATTAGEGSMAVFLSRVYEICHAIPYGSVTSYGHIAKLAGYPRHARHVGNAMRDLPAGTTVPWQRVIASNGTISPRGDQNLGAQRQRDALIAENVEVADLMGAGVGVENFGVRGGGGRYKVDLRRYGWFPDRFGGW